ncbi:MAG TPA: hypothetical protein VHF25_11720, partial [Nitriliruptorales bacterium]|nr:hypothetical protein [Nitriliruptorales bacterium]
RWWWCSRSRRSESVWSRWWCWAAVGLLTVGTLVTDRTPSWDSLLLYAVFLLASWILGDTVRRSQREAQLHVERARQLEAAREELARHAATQERLRIARELHAGAAAAMARDAAMPGLLPAWAGVILLSGYTAAFLAAGAVRTVRANIT